MSKRPKVVFSSCLLGEMVRYDGGSATSPLAISLSRFVEVIKVCPEMELGLGTPRPRIILYKTGETDGAYQPETGRDLTLPLEDFSKNFLSILPPVKGFLLKSRSPSCGVSGTKIYKDREGSLLISRGSGLFARAVKVLYHNLAVEDEERLTRFRGLRLRFLTALFVADEATEYRKIRRMSLKEVEELARLFVPRDLLEEWMSYP